MRSVLLITLTCFLTSFLYSQSISGNMNTKASGAALKYGTVDIYKGEKLVASVLTDRLGNFSVALDTGTYVCVLNYAGFESEKKEIRVTKDEVAEFKMKEDELAKSRIESIKKSEGSEKEKMIGRLSPSSVYSAPSGGVSGIHSVDDYSLGDVRGIGGNIGAAGKLTAGEINDFSKWKLWQKFSENELKSYSSIWNLAPFGRYTVMLQSENGLPIADAQVQLLLDKKVLFSTRTDNTGKAECWLTIKNEKPEVSGKLEIFIQANGKSATIRNVKTFEKGLNHQTLSIACQDQEIVDIAFVVDATGSMGDEIEYLKAEMNDVIFQSKQISNSLNFRFANVFYRDHGDAYVTKKMDFNRILTESSTFIDQQFAGGGGDYPEAMDIALDTAINALTWSENARSRILFFVLDAPPHQGQEVNDRLQRLIHQAAEKGVRIVPIGASGIDKSTEYLMRALALGTNGTYTFLTDHSGIGNPHIKPTTDSYDVETLNALLVRIIKSFTYMPDCNSQIPDLKLNIPDSIVSNVKTDSLDSLKKDPPTKITWSYYPNPTNGIVQVLPNTDIKELYITDLSGKVLQIHSNLKKDERIQIDLSNYVTGVYLIRYLDENDHWLSGKVVLQRTS